MREITAKAGTELDLGKRGENLATRVTFDVTGWQTYGEGSFILLHKRNGDKTPYPCVVEVDNGKVFWNVTNTDTDIAGRGYAELQYIVGDVVVKSVTFNTKTTQALGKAGETPPPPAAGWLEQMVELGVQTETNAADAAVAAETAETASAEATAAAENAVTLAENAETYAALAKTYKRKAIDSAEAAAESAEAAAGSAQEAAEMALQAAETAIDATKQELSDYVSAAESAQDAAAESEAKAKEYMEQAGEIVGGDFATNASLNAHTEAKNNPHGVTAEQVGADASGSAAQALADAKSYTDTKIAAIPTPDVSGQINSHNSNTSAHSDIRNSINTHTSNKSNPHGVTAEQIGAAASSHNHSASNITSGTLGVARGGTGNTSVDTTPTSGSTKMVTSGGVYTALAGKAASSHNQAASTITAGTLAGKVLANASATATLTNSQVRNIHANTTDMTAGTTALTNGAIYLCYE